MKFVVAGLLVFGAFATTVPACGKRHVQIDRDTRRMIDTLASAEIQILRPVMDSLCTQQLDSLVRTLRDSVLAERREEMRKLLGK
jgi:hypothetical protein